MLVALTLAAACAPTRAPVELGTAPADERSISPTTTARRKAEPRWIQVAHLSGSGDRTTESFDIATGMLQWRVTVTCESGPVRVGVDGDSEPLVDETCPGRHFGFSILTGRRTLDVRAAGPWKALVEQQVDEPIDEPPLPGMTDRNRLASGAFAGVEQQGDGTATLYRLPGGGRALRLDPFFVTPEDDLFVWASEAEAPTTSADALFTPHVQLEALKATSGEQNYLVPDSLPTDRIRSIVIWCEPVRTAYSAAPLRRA